LKNKLHREQLTYTKIFLLWLPLAAMWLMMGIEMPLINAVIARLNEAKTNLAAFGITLSISLLMEAPVIQLLTAGTALANSRNNYNRLMMFMHILAISITLLHLLIGITPLYTLLLKYIIGVPEDIIEISRRSFIWMFPWTAAIGYRRLWQGVIIRYGKTRVIPITMIIRLVTMAIVLLAGFYLPNISGAEIGGIALTTGVIFGALSSYIFLKPIVKNLKYSNKQDTLSWLDLKKFYFPLALTSFVSFIVRPVLSFGIARAAFPLESLAIWPVVISLMFLFSSMAMAYQEVVVSLLKETTVYKQLSRFAIYLGLLLTVLLALIAISPLCFLFYKYIAGLNEDLLPYTQIPTIILAMIPLISSMISWYRGVLIYKNQTRTIAIAVIFNSIVLLLIIILGPLIFNIPGVIIAAAAYMLSMFAEVLYLRIRIIS
jgi:progressive ankylosis protein